MCVPLGARVQGCALRNWCAAPIGRLAYLESSPTCCGLLGGAAAGPVGSQSAPPQSSPAHQLGTMASTFLLFESASGYGLFEVTAMDELGAGTDALQQAVSNLDRFGRAVKLAAFRPHSSAANALEQINAVSESQVRARRARCQACGRHGNAIGGCMLRGFWRGHPHAWRGAICGTRLAGRPGQNAGRGRHCLPGWQGAGGAALVQPGVGETTTPASAPQRLARVRSQAPAAGRQRGKLAGAQSAHPGTAPVGPSP